MLIKSLLKAKTDTKEQLVPKIDLYGSDDEVLDSGHNNLAAELSISSDEDSDVPEKAETKSKTDLDKPNDSHNEGSSSKKNKSSRKDKTKKKSKKREKDIPDEITDGSVKNKKKKKKEKDKKNRKRHKSGDEVKADLHEEDHEKFKQSSQSVVPDPIEATKSIKASAKAMSSSTTKTNVFTSDGSDSDRHSQYRNKSEAGKKTRGRAPKRIIADLSHPPKPLSPLSSPSSISSPVRRPFRRSSRSSSQNSSSSSSTPRSVIKTPSPLPTTHNRHISTSSEEDVKQEKAPEPPNNLAKARKPVQKVQKSHIIRKSPYISDSDSDMSIKSEKKTSKTSIKTAAKKRELKKAVRPRSISSSSSFSSPDRAQNSHSPSKGKLKKGSRKPKSSKSPPKAQKAQNKDRHDSKMESKQSCPFPSASAILHAPTPLSPIADSPPSSPGSNSFDRQNYKKEEFNITNEEEHEHFLQPSSPLKSSRRQRHTPKQTNNSQKPVENKNGHYHDETQLPPASIEMDASITPKNENGEDNSLEKLLQDDQYYPVQESHKDFVPITKLNDEYVDFLLVLQNRIANPQPEDNLVEIAELIQETGCWDVQNDEFIFDLGLIEKATIKKIVKSLKLYPQ